jgi:hypothetical protein
MAQKHLLTPAAERAQGLFNSASLNDKIFTTEAQRAQRGRRELRFQIKNLRLIFSVHPQYPLRSLW